MATVACTEDHPAILSFCFSSGLLIRKTDCNDHIIQSAMDLRSSPIYEVLLNEDRMDIHHYLEHRGDVLHAAVYDGDIELVKFLLARGADRNSGATGIDGDDEITIVWAVIGDENYGRTDMLKILFDYGASIMGTSVLVKAAECGNTAALNMILEMRSDEVDFSEATKNNHSFSQFRSHKGTTIYNAAAAGYADIVDNLIIKGADIGFMDELGWSIIQNAWINGHDDLAYRLEQLMSLFTSN
ncbi:MAG: hypothetical protein Q9213_002682 [Squamulea squamosa]